MNSKMTTDSQLSTTEPKNQNQNQNKLRKQLEQEQNHRNGDYMEVINGEEQGENGEKVQGIRNIIGRHKIGRGRLRIV